MKTVIATIGLVGAFVFAGNAALAAGKSTCTPGHNKPLLAALYGAGGAEQAGSPTPGGVADNLGGYLSGGFYGNTSNSGLSPYAPANGHGVTPSISPGPQTVGGGGPGTGTSIGDIIQLCPPS